MSLPRFLTTVLISLALVAGGIAPGFAKEMHPAADTAVESPCHGMDGKPIQAEVDPSVADDCCDGGDCRCDCLQQTPGTVLVLRGAPVVSADGLLADVDPASHVPAKALPAARPPIA